MTDRLVVSAAEVAFMLATFDPQGTSAAVNLLGLTEEERSDAVVAAGFSSLLVRGLVVAEGENVQLAPSTGAVAYGLTRAVTCVQVGFVATGHSDGTIVFDAGTVRFMISPRAHRCFEVVGLSTDTPLAEPLAHLAGEFLRSYRPGVVSMVIGLPAADRPTAQLASVLMSAAPAGDWSVGRSADSDTAQRDLTEQEAITRFTAALRELLSHPQPAR